MATYTHATPSRYTNANQRDGTLKTYTRKAKKLLSRLRPTTAESENANRLFGLGWPEFGSSLGTNFTPATGVVLRTYRATAVGGKSRTR